MTIRIMNAAGTCKNPAGVGRLLRSAVTDVTIGSITVDKRDGNEGTTFAILDDGTSVNSLGLPNSGTELYETSLPHMARQIRKAGKNPRVSIAGFSPEQFALLARFVQDCGVDDAEANVGCPNVRDGGEQKPIPAYNPPLLMDTLSALSDVVQDGMQIDLKLSPYTDEQAMLRDEVCNIVASMPFVTGVVLANTLPNFRPTDEDGKPLITATDGFGGMAGAQLKPYSIANVKWFREHLPKNTEVIGAGGISTGQDLLDYLQAGASAVQIGTAYYASEAPSIFSDILAEFAELPDAVPFLEIEASQSA